MSLRTAREAAGYSQTDVAKLLNIHQSAVSLWETGKHFPRTAFLAKLSGLYGCTIDDLLRAPEQGPETLTDGQSSA